MQYNTGRYNEHQYNTDFYSLLLSDSLSATDSDVVKDIFITKSDSTSLSESQVVDDTLAVLTEVITSTDVRTLIPYLTEVETITLSGTLLPFTISQVLLDTITLADVKTFSMATCLMDFLFFSELIKVEITNKALNDTIRLNDWISIKKPFVEYWRD